MSFRPRRFLTHLALAYAAGVFAGYRLTAEPLWLTALPLSLLLAALLRVRGYSAYLGCMLLLFFGGLARCAWAAHPALPPEGTYRVTATAQGEARIRESDGRFAVWLRGVELCDEAGGRYTLSRAYWTYWPQSEEESPPLDGQRVSFSGSVYEPSGRRNPFGFDFRLYLLQRGACVGISGGKELETAAQSGHKSLWLRARVAIRERLSLLLGADGALAQTLILNDKSGMPEELTESFRTAGVAHVLAVSGLHVMILFSLVTALLRRFSPSPRLVALLSLTLLTLYCLLADAQAAMLRACILLAYTQLGRIVRRRGDALTAWSLALLTVLLLRPLELWNAGFQLSFAAVLGIIVIGDRLRVCCQRVQRRRLRALLQAYGVSFAASLATAIPVIAVYHRLSLIGLLINPLLVAAVSCLLPVFLTLLALSFVWLPLAQAIAPGVALLSRVTAGFVRLAASAPYASVALPTIPWHLAAALALCLWLCSRYTRLPVKARWRLGAGALTAALAVTLLTSNRDVRYLQLDMGDADAAVIEDGGTTIVIDTGENSGDLADYLLASGRRADTVILTHLHTDHALGLQTLLDEGVTVGCVCLSTEALRTPVAESCRALLTRVQAENIPIETLRAGDEITSGRVRIRVLWPQEGGATPLGDGNDFALALAIDLNGVSMLHMSDVSGAYELYAAQGAQVLKVAHHGSASSTGERFLTRVQPQMALVSARQGSAATLERLAAAGAAVYQTGERGALILTVRGGEVLVRGYIR